MNTKFKLIFTIIITVAAIIIALPNFYSQKSNNRVHLGLDLQGGSHLLLDIDFNTYFKNQYENLVNDLRKLLRSKKINYQQLSIGNNVVNFTLKDATKIDQTRQIIKDMDQGFKITNVENKISITYTEDRILELKNKVIDQSIEIVRMRVDSTGTQEPSIQRQGNQYILLQMPGTEDPNYVKSVLGKMAKLTFHFIDEYTTYSEMKEGKIPLDSTIVSNQDGTVVIKKNVLLAGETLTDAQATFNQGTPVVSFSLNNLGSRIFAEITKNNSGKRIAIVLDNQLISAAKINEPIPGGHGIITGNFTIDSANELALLLRAGALPAPLTVIEERTIGPSLGADSIISGKKAGIIGFISVLVFMIWTYGIFGIFANIALIFGMVYILAMLSLFEATLTLPGIAGIILTIGMAVDANVLIYEHIREELLKGASNIYSIHQGFRSAFSTILDSNITTLIAAILLYIFGVGTIKGFAVTLSVGIFASMFSAIVITKLLIDLWVQYAKPKNLGLL